MDEAERLARRRRRREARGRHFDDTIPSPCLQICQVNSASTHCIGCLRTLDEIRDWPIMTAEEKRSVLLAIDERRAEGGESGPP